MRTLTMKALGSMGRFANQIYQYAFLRLYAKQWKCQLQLPPWVGCELFGCDEPPITVNLARGMEEWNPDHLGEHVPPKGDEFVNSDWCGYAQYHTSYYRPWKQEFRGFFRPVPKLDESLRGSFSKLRKTGETVIGLHVRRGDYGQHAFHLTPIEWYKRWLIENWDRFKSPVLFVATEDRGVLDDLADWSPLVTDDLGITLAPGHAHYNYLSRDLRVQEPWQMDFYPDFYGLTQCDVIVGSNSTYSFAAAMLNERLQEFWRSSLPEGYFEHIDPWNARPLRMERVEDPQYAHLEGIRLPENPYW